MKYVVSTVYHSKNLLYYSFVEYPSPPRDDRSIFWSTEHEIDMEQHMYLELEQLQPFGG
jgi:hypothetical protein